MAEGKKSFVLYADLVYVARKLPKDTRGDLFLVILEYVNDNLDVVQAMEQIDILLSVTFEPIKQQLKRDLKKYETIKEKRTLAGKASAESRQQNQHVLTCVESVQQTSTNPTVNDNVNVNVNVNDNVNDNVNGSVVYNISDTTHNLGLGIDYRKSYDSMNDEFKKLYEREVYNSYIDLMKKLHVECRFLAQWENQLTIYEFKKIYDRIISKEITSSEVRQALIDLDANKQAKDKYNSVAHGLNIYLKTIISRR